MNNRPNQLKKIREEHYEELYGRNPQLVKRLTPLFRKVEIIQNNTEPKLVSPNDPLNSKLKEPTLKRLRKRKVREKLKKFDNSKKPNQVNKIQKVSHIRENVLFGLR